MPLQGLAPFKSPRRSAATQTSSLVNVPAPVGGLNLRDPISAMSPIDAVVLDNMIPRQTGVELRAGYQVFTDEIGYEPKSVFAYSALNGDDKLFAAANGNIYDITDGTVTVSQSATGSTDDIWSTTMFSTGADNFLLAVSASGGYWTYSNASGWIKRTPSSLPTSGLNSVMVWKQRVFFTVKNSANIYYMHNVNVVTGSTSAFNMGSQLRNGGYICGLISWTLDAGVGIDDHLVVVGSQGDLSVWTGTDPQSANTFAIKGTWYVGPVPTIGRFFTAFGGDVMILSEMGLVPVSKLVNGQFVESNNGVSSKIQSVLTPLVRQLRNVEGWDIFIVPSQDILVIKLPPQYSVYQQFAMNITTGAWCTFSNMPMFATTIWDGELYFCTGEVVCHGLYGKRDGIALDGTGGDPIEGDVQTSFQAFDTAGQIKRFGLARPVFVAPEAPSVKLRVNTQYQFTGVEGSPAFSQEALAYWDSAVWNAALWVGGTDTYESWVGATGLGYYGSIRMKVRGVPQTLFMSSHLMVNVGGMM